MESDLNTDVLDTLHAKMTHPRQRADEGRACSTCGSTFMWVEKVIVNNRVMENSSPLKLKPRQPFDSMRSAWVKSLMPEMGTLQKHNKLSLDVLVCYSCGHCSYLNSELIPPTLTYTESNLNITSETL